MAENYSTSSTNLSSTYSSTFSSSTSTQLHALIPLSNSTSTTPSHLQQSFSIKLNSKNYIPWKLQFQPLLNFYNLHDVLTGIEISPPKEILNQVISFMKPNPEYLQWFNKDQLLFSWLLSSIFEEVYPHLIGFNSSSAVWKILETTYGVVNNAQCTQLYIKLHNLKKDDKIVSDYLF